MNTQLRQLLENNKVLRAECERLRKEVNYLRAELDQERKLAKHLDAKVERMEEQANNLIEENDNQFDTIERMQRQLTVAQRRYDDANELNKKLVETNEARLNTIHNLEGQLDSKWANDMTVQELETQGMEIGAQVQVLMQQLNNLRTMR